MYVRVNVHSELFLDRKPNKYIYKYNIYTYVCFIKCGFWIERHDEHLTRTLLYG